MEFLLILLVSGLLIWAMLSAAKSRQTSGDAGGTCHDRDGGCDGDGGD